MYDSWNVEDLEPFFFEAMCHGYATSPEKKEIVELPGSKLITFVKGLLKLTDCWQTNIRTNRSFGMTVIYFNDDPVWMMHYWGEYESTGISVLKEALKTAYFGQTNPHSKQSSFNGCRGPRIFNDGCGYGNYTNIVEPDSSFCNFSGIETVANCRHGDILGWLMVE